MPKPIKLHVNRVAATFAEWHSRAVGKVDVELFQELVFANQKAVLCELDLTKHFLNDCGKSHSLRVRELEGFGVLLENYWFSMRQKFISEQFYL